MTKPNNEQKYPSCIDPDLIDALEKAKEWVRDVKACWDLGQFPGTPPTDLISALKKIEADRLQSESTNSESPSTLIRLVFEVSR